ncbi:uncharacterized protein LOC113852880 isoform X3 [Abrus precatorius]|uniref:Uncharacterized protein LOC113852880 isoform X3 n=1 Tax=Abrus precatorius TaxID=3816 RepID=A0A8B8K5X4_ABRPR|nr:uncharacterized protein LOC113852880 isoform X3 [Abrus precatorius]
MAGMLPGVECARRRRFHQSGGYMDLPSLASHTSTRRSSFCLYASNHESRFSSLQRSNLYQAHPDENMLGAAREAKQRLDDKFRAQRMSENQRQHEVCGGWKNKLSRIANRGIWVKEKRFKEVELDQMELESLRTRGLCSVLGIIQGRRDTNQSPLCP